MTDELRFKRIKDWLKKHPAIQMGIICDIVGYDRGNWTRALKGDRPIPSKHLTAFEKELKKYGYKK